MSCDRGQRAALGPRVVIGCHPAQCGCHSAQCVAHPSLYPLLIAKRGVVFVSTTVKDDVRVYGVSLLSLTCGPSTASYAGISPKTPPPPSSVSQEGRNPLCKDPGDPRGPCILHDENNQSHHAMPPIQALSSHIAHVMERALLLPASVPPPSSRCARVSHCSAARPTWSSGRLCSHTAVANRSTHQAPPAA